MQIDLTNEQYRKLLVLIFLGEWMANTADAQETELTDVQDVADYLYTMAPQFGAEDWVEYCNECGGHHGNQTMEDALVPVLNDYEEETFWDMLSYHLAYRDVMLTSGPDRELSSAMEMRLWRRKEQYDQEFQKHGLDHVRLVFHGGRSARPKPVK